MAAESDSSTLSFTLAYLSGIMARLKVVREAGIQGAYQLKKGRRVYNGDWLKIFAHKLDKRILALCVPN